MRPRTLWPWLLASFLVLGMAACGKQSPESAEASAGKDETSLVDKVRAAVSSEVELPAGTELQVRLSQTVSSAGARAGEKFQATLNAPVVLGNQVVLPKGATFSGRVTTAVPSGRLKTPARLALTLEALEWKGATYPVATNSLSRSAKSHKKRNLALIGGGSGAGALIGGLAGGGTGALIGAGAGAAAGTAGAYSTGKKDIVLPAETLLTFRLEAPVKIKKG